LYTAPLCDFECFDGASKQKTQQNQRFAGLWHLLVCLFVTPSGFLSCIEIQYVEYLVDRIVDLEAKSWMYFTRFYLGKSGLTKVR